MKAKETEKLINAIFKEDEKDFGITEACGTWHRTLCAIEAKQKQGKRYDAEGARWGDEFKGVIREVLKYVGRAGYDVVPAAENHLAKNK